MLVTLRVQQTTVRVAWESIGNSMCGHISARNQPHHRDELKSRAQNLSPSRQID
jgi:hypothetical protein